MPQLQQASAFSVEQSLLQKSKLEFSGWSFPLHQLGIVLAFSLSRKWTSVAVRGYETNGDGLSGLIELSKFLPRH